MSGSDDFSFSERNKRAKTSVNVPPPESAGPAPEYSAPPPRDPNQNYTPPPPRNSPPPPRDYTPPPPREYLPPPNPEPAPRAKSDDDDEDGEIEMPIDPWRLVGALRRRWLWLVCAALVCLPLGALAGYLLANYKVGVALIKRDVSAPFEAGVGGEVFKPHALQAATLISLMESSQLRQRVSAATR